MSIQEGNAAPSVDAQEAAEERFRLLFERSNDAIFIVETPSGRYIDANHAAELLLGRTLGEIRMLTTYDVTPADARNRLEVTSKTSDTLHWGEVEYLRPDMSVRTATLDTISLSSTRIFGIARDITERKREKQALRESEEKYRALVDNSPDAIAVHVDGIVVFVNNECVRLMAAESKEALVGRSVIDFVHPDDRALVVGRMKDVKMSGRPLPTERERFLRNDGSTIDVEVRAMQTTYNQRPAVQIIVHDITVSKRAEEALKESEKHLKETQIIAELGTYTMDVATGEWTSSEILDGIFGIDSGYHKSLEAWGAIIHPEWRRMMIDYVLQDVIGKRGRFDKEYKIVRRNDGSEGWVHGRGELKFNDRGEPVSMVGTIRDITSRKRAEEKLQKIESRLRQSEKMDAIGQLAGGIAHDFNNVLGGIIGYTDMSLGYAERDSILEKNLQKVLMAADRAKRLVQQILTFSRQGNPQKSVINIRPIVSEVLDLLRASIPSSVIIESDLSAETRSVQADPTQIHQALLNLTTNAVHAMNRRGTLSIALYPLCLDHGVFGQSGEIVPGEYTVVEITDTGCGMDAATLSKAFEPFFTTKPVGEGTGMGLSVVIGVAQSHGGDLQVESVPGKGTTMRILLPVSVEPVAKGTNEHAHAPLRGTERILVVDDEQMMVDMVSEWLVKSGYMVTGMTDSAAALDRLRQCEFDLLITDQTMPGMTGIELAAAAFAHRKHLPIILYTGFSTEVNADQAASIGIRRFVMKPYRPTELGRIIRDVLDAQIPERRTSTGG